MSVEKNIHSLTNPLGIECVEHVAACKSYNVEFRFGDFNKLVFICPIVLILRLIVHTYPLKNWCASCIKSALGVLKIRWKEHLGPFENQKINVS